MNAWTRFMNFITGAAKFFFAALVVLLTGIALWVILTPAPITPWMVLKAILALTAGILLIVGLYHPDPAVDQWYVLGGIGLAFVLLFVSGLNPGWAWPNGDGEPEVVEACVHYIGTTRHALEVGDRLNLPNGGYVECVAPGRTHEVTAPPAGGPETVSDPPVDPGSPSNYVGKCDWLRQNFPQTTLDIQNYGAALAGVQPERIRTHVYRCTPTTTVFDGFIVLGPNEGYAGEFSLDVPVGGAVDTYQGAVCTGESDLLGAATDTVRCFNGTVMAVTATYWPWLDENPPTSGAVSSTTMATTCMDPVDLASESGWTVTGSPDQYGGLVVVVDDNESLPMGWEASHSGGKILENDDSRMLQEGQTYTVYPPFECRAELGYSN